MSFQQKNVSVSLANFALILIYLSFRVLQMILTGSFTSTNVFRLWAIIIILAVVVTIFAPILTHIVSAILHAIKTKEEPEVEDIQDERDILIDLKGSKVTYRAYSIGVLLAMLTFVLGQPPLVMFTLLILAGVLAQVLGDGWRLFLYRRGFSYE